MASGVSAHQETSGEADAATIGDELVGNIAFRIGDEGEFVRHLLGDLTPYPRYYAHMGPANLAGPAPIDLIPPRGIDVDEIRHRVDAGEWVVDVRPRLSFATAHTRGTIGMEGGDSFLTYLGWLIPWGTPVTLLADTPQQITDAQRSLNRIGIDRPAAAASGGTPTWGDGDPASYPVVDFPEVRNVFGTDGTAVLDVRRTDEWREGHIGGSTNLPIQDLPDRLGDLSEATFYVHCETGYRASVACSFLDRAGISAVLVDDEFANAARVGLPIGDRLVTRFEAGDVPASIVTGVGGCQLPSRSFFALANSSSEILPWSCSADSCVS